MAWMLLRPIRKRDGEGMFRRDTMLRMESAALTRLNAHSNGEKHTWIKKNNSTSGLGSVFLENYAC